MRVNSARAVSTLRFSALTFSLGILFAVEEDLEGWSLDSEIAASRILICSESFFEAEDRRVESIWNSWTHQKKSSVHMRSLRTRMGTHPLQLFYLIGSQNLAVPAIQDSFTGKQFQ